MRSYSVTQWVKCELPVLKAPHFTEDTESESVSTLKEFFHSECGFDHTRRLPLTRRYNRRWMKFQMCGCQPRRIARRRGDGANSFKRVTLLIEGAAIRKKETQDIHKHGTATAYAQVRRSQIPPALLQSLNQCQAPSVICWTPAIAPKIGYKLP